MPKFVNEVQKFRHRGFEPNDGGPRVMMFGSDPEPLNADGSPMHKLWDNDVEQTIHVTEHVQVEEAVPGPI